MFNKETVPKVHKNSLKQRQVKRIAQKIQQTRFRTHTMVEPRWDSNRGTCLNGLSPWKPKKNNKFICSQTIPWLIIPTSDCTVVRHSFLSVSLAIKWYFLFLVRSIGITLSTIIGWMRKLAGCVWVRVVLKFNVHRWLCQLNLSLSIMQMSGASSSSNSVRRAVLVWRFVFGCFLWFRCHYYFC